MDDEIVEYEGSLKGGVDSRPMFALTWENEDAVDVLLLAARSLEDHDFSKAFQFIEAAIKLDPQWLSSYLMAGDLSLKHHRISDAISWFQKCLDLNPNEAVVYDKLSKAYYKSNDINKAIYFLEKLIEFQPNNPSACLLKIRWLGESKRWMEIDEFFQVHHSAVQESGEARLWRCLAIAHLRRIDETRLLFEEASLKSKRQHPEIARQIALIIGDDYRN